jgi:MoxR-like ATPase
MKIKKTLLEKVEKLIEDDNIKSDVSKEAVENDLELSKEEEQKVTTEIEKASDQIQAKKEIVDLDLEDTELLTKNSMTNWLDRCLATSIANHKSGVTDRANLLICGLPGSGKTAIVYDWAKKTKGADTDFITGEKITDRKINLVYLNMKNNDLEAYINGYTAIDPQDKDATKQIFSKALDGLDRPNSVLFLDEYNRQTKAQIRGSVLSLINEHYIVGNGAGGKRYFPNFLFTVAVMNPSLGSTLDPGAAEINDAEKSRFVYRLENQNSDKNTAQQYINNFSNLQIKRELAKKEPDYKFIEKALRLRHLGLFIVKDPSFHFDGEFLPEELETLKANVLLNNRNATPRQIEKAIARAKATKEVALTRELKQENATLFNQRLLTSALNTCQGENGSELQDFEDWLTYTANLLEETDNMLWAILEAYVVPTREQLFKSANIAIPDEAFPEDKKEDEEDKIDEISQEEIQDANEDEDIELEDDKEFANKTSIADDISSQISDIIDNW